MSSTAIGAPPVLPGELDTSVLGTAAPVEAGAGHRVVRLGDFAIDAMTEADVIAHVLGELRAGRGGRMLTLNVDIFRAATLDPALKRLVSGASLTVADGMPVVWASRLSRAPVPERVAGASLIFSLTQGAAREGRSIYLLGGAPGVPQQAGAALQRLYPSLRVDGTDAPPLGFDARASGRQEVRARLVEAQPDIAYIGLGFPKQERLIADVAPDLPSCWFIGCGAAISFAAGVQPRAPRWLQEAGLEWLYRLAREPRRLAHRYLIEDLPFMGRMMAACVGQRFAGEGRPQPKALPDPQRPASGGQPAA
jgi:N-acetylglucosaminyldiphosphoundecaprenol N-acetyl-beta-D-mannosaminyltransferase